MLMNRDRGVLCSRLIVHKRMGSIPIGAGLMVELMLFFLSEDEKRERGIEYAMDLRTLV
jgi:hypothetical protein